MNILVEKGAACAPIIVLGMHRSGTSAITRGLQVLGANLGGKLIPPVPGVNDKGFWEDIDINALNNEMLKAVGGDWFSLTPVGIRDVENLQSQGFLLRAIELLREKMNVNALFAFKDPRVAKLLPFWNQVAEHLRLNAGYVLALRNPLSVAQSLAKRDHLFSEHSYLLWLGHVLESLRGSEGKPRVVVDYDRLMLHPDVELARVARALHLEVDAAAFEDYKTNFLDRQLQHTVYRPEDLLLDNACPPIVREVYARLLDVASDQTSIDDRVLGAKLQKWLQEFEWLSTSLKLADKQLERLSFQNHALAEREGQIASLNQAVTERDGQIASLNQAVTERDGQIASLNRALAERDGQIAQICSSKSWRLTRPLRASRLIMSRVKLGLKHPVRSLWRLLPLSSRQKFRLKAAGEYRLLENNLALTLLDQDFVPLSAECVDSERVTIKTIAFYLPQFHPIPENDKNWGLGFTEWTNVSKATPQFVGHYQPRLPGELGFYDLRLKEIQRRQIELARQYGIHGFCYHHYWFNGKRVLEKPFQQVLNDPSLDLPFCLCWANENWTRRWDGGDQDIILAQNYSPEDDLAFFADILPALQDPRYIRVDGRPLLIIYRPGLLPDAAATAQRWRQAAAEAGLPGLFIVSAATFSFEDYKSIGYDGLVQFPPHNVAASDITEQQTLLNQHFSGRVYDYKQYAENAIKSIIGKKHVFPCVMMNWDNEARRPGKGHIFFGGTPQNYKTWLRRCFDFVLSNNTESERLVFINAWNEWAEGTYLEPDRRYGYAYLHATADLLRHYYKPADIDEIIAHNNARFTKRNDSALVVHLYYFDLFDELHYLIAENSKLDVFITIPIHFSREQTEKIASSLDNVYLVQVPNRGRDILPFVVMYQVIRNYGYDYLLKVHSKKSPHLPDGVLRGRRAWQELLDPKTVAQAIQTLSADATVGLIGPSNSLLSLANFDYLVNNQIRLKDCLDRLRLADTPLGFEFIAGSMFWARVDALRLLSDLSLCEDDFEEELGQLDGTLAHTIERLFSFFGERTGYRTLTVDQLA